MAQEQNQEWVTNLIICLVILFIFLCINPFITLVVVWLGMIAFSYVK